MIPTRPPLGADAPQKRRGRGNRRRRLDDDLHSFPNSPHGAADLVFRYRHNLIHAFAQN